MPNANKIIYSLRVNLLLQKKGFIPIATMQNPYKPKLFCWVYEQTPHFQKVLDDIMGGVSK